jgi:myotubularin-related protein 6/7/8
LSSLAQICLDPFYRTFNGLQILIEKEWCAFGHKFSDRCGHLAEAKGESSETTSIMAQIEAGSKNFWNSAAKTLMTLSGASDSQSSIDSSSQKALKPKEASPVFTQFLDCLYQIWRQFPTQFEYNEQILGYLNKHVYSCEFGDFLMNCERERRQYLGEGLHKSTLSIWEDVRSKSYIFANPLYSPNQQETVLIPNPDQIICWPLILQGQEISIQPSADNSDLVMSQLSELDIQSKESKSQTLSTIPSHHSTTLESSTIETNADPLGVLLG